MYILQSYAFTEAQKGKDHDREKNNFSDFFNFKCPNSNRARPDQGGIVKQRKPHHFV
jgi:hypothetical protein